MATQHLKQELEALSSARGRDDGALGNENLTEMVSNLPRRLQSRSPSAIATRPTCAGRVALHTDSSHLLRASIYNNND